VTEKQGAPNIPILPEEMIIIRIESKKVVKQNRIENGTTQVSEQLMETEKCLNTKTKNLQGDNYA